MLRHLLLAIVATSALARVPSAFAAATDVDWTFESGGAGWATERATLDLATPAANGASAGRLTATSQGSCS